MKERYIQGFWFAEYNGNDRVWKVWSPSEVTCLAPASDGVLPDSTQETRLVQDAKRAIESLIRLAPDSGWGNDEPRVDININTNGTVTVWIGTDDGWYWYKTTGEGRVVSESIKLALGNVLLGWLLVD